eukprot:CAMPEP_0181403538 /NCGR_PEP_ID=MMETSP1110-20121109/3760_1 /TAXON_ID=174948 /ORGANISM="Symbiodinium sp., Strain CCMP421" /LENGTH=105 /DNA_ID=CAMNT_0023525827 /DNA_START=164 /DNA_END=477 /DNA_ORIENTATION=-
MLTELRLRGLREGSLVIFDRFRVLPFHSAAAPMVQIGSPEGLIRFALPSGDAVEVCKVALAQRASFFAPLADECGEAVYSQNDLQHVYASLAPGARQAVPARLRA